MGYKLGKLSFEGGQTKYELTAPDGTTTKASATDIKELVYKGSSDPKDQAKKIPKGRREMATSYGLETRCCSFEREGNRLTGYAAVYDAPSHPLVVRSVNGGKPFTERVARGAFDQSLRGNISLLVGHDRRELLANTKSQRLKLASDERGLAFDVQLPDTQRAKDVYALVDSGVLSEMSFGFVVRSDAWKGSERTLTQVDLREVSIVESGAYPQTSAEARTYSPALARLRLRLRALT